MNKLLLALSLLAPVSGCSDADGPDTPPSDSAGAVTAPAPASTSGDLSSEAEAWLRAAYPDMQALRYRSGSVDLDGDGADELLVYPAGPMLCGSGGCNLVILRKADGDWNKVAETTVTQLPVGVLDTRSSGWLDLWVTIGGGGMARATMRLAFDGRTYPSNPTVPPAAPVDPGNVVIEDGELTPLD